MARMFERLGYMVRQTPYRNDQGRDAILSKDGHKFLLECKRYGENNVSGRPDLQKFHSAIVTEKAVLGFFVTTGGFTKEAKEFAAGVPIKLVNQNELVKMMFHSKPAGKDDDSYQSMCRKCQEIVYHRLRSPQVVKCRNGHEVESTLKFEDLAPASVGRARA
jgi:restriction endonuclease Mrr